MPAGKKRASKEVEEHEQGQDISVPTKIARRTRASSPSKGKKTSKKATTKPSVSTSKFLTGAMPLHVHLTHTPPAVNKDDSPATIDDPGFIGNLTLVPSAFQTGSYGWKGNKRIKVEIQGEDGVDKETVQVQLTINATVLGSKQAPEEDEDEEAETPPAAVLDGDF